MKVVSKILLPSLLLLGLFWMAFHWSAPAQAAPTASLAPGGVLYRVNAGGPALPAADGSTPAWSADTMGTPSPYVTFPTDQGRVYTTTKVITLNPSVPAAAPPALFQTERFDQPPGGPYPLSTEMRWAFPVEQGKEVEIRLYFAEIYPPIDTPGERIFDVAVDDVVPPVYDDIDIVALASGNYKGIVLVHTTTSDGVVNLDFLHTGVENPQIKGIEILEAVPVDPGAPTVANPLDNVNVLQDTAPSTVNLTNVFTDVEDGNNLTLSIVTNTNPTLVTSTLDGAQLTLTYAPGQHGDAVVTIRATDSSNLSVDESFVVTVNGKPTVATVADQTVAAESTLNLLLTASDPESETITLTVAGLPNGATFFDNQDGTANLTWTPTFADVGAYPVSVTATDSNGQADTKSFTITVTAPNRAPEINAIGNQAINEGAPLTVNISATDPDGGALILTAANLPNGATFTDNGDGTATLTWTPGAGTAGVYTVSVTATDSNNLSDVQTFTITVAAANTNLPPVLAPVNNQTISEGASITITIAAIDNNGDAITLAASGLPAGATFTDNQNGTGRLTWTTDFDDAGVYTVTVTAQDPLGAIDTDSFKITVTNVNRKPTIAVTGNQAVAEGARMTLEITATDPDGDAITLKATNLPTTASFTDNKNGTGTLSWPTTVGDAGSYDVTITATDAQNASATQVLNLQVNPKGQTASQSVFLPIVSR